MKNQCHIIAEVTGSSPVSPTIENEANPSGFAFNFAPFYQNYSSFQSICYGGTGGRGLRTSYLDMGIHLPHFCLYSYGLVNPLSASL